MGDKNDCVSFVFEADQHIEEAADLVGSQNRGRLVKNHHTGTFVDENLDDFNMLALPQIQLPDLLIGVDTEMILLRDFKDSFAEQLLLHDKAAV